jgi:hypothetical protein
MTIEIALIATQAARGVAPHLNTATPLDSTIFMIMGATITVNTLVVGYVLWRVLRDPPALAPAYLWSLRLGMFVFFVASFEGWLMVARDGHAVGAPADSAGRTLLNWSLTGGDLRIAHFIGLHSLQVLPFTGYVATQWTGLSTRGSLTVVGVVAALYGGLTGVTFVQAMLGLPMLSSVTLPSVPPSLAAGLLFVATIFGGVVLTATWRGGSAS